MRADLSVQLPSGRETQVGTIEEIGAARRQVIEFRYATSYLQDAESYPLSPELTLDRGNFTPTGQRAMLGGISDAQPDSWGRRLIRSDRLRTRQPRATEVDVLAAVNDLTRQGALRVKVNGRYVSESTSPTPTIVDLPALIEAAQAFEANEEVPEKYRRLLLIGTSGGGARPKATVRNAAGQLAIAKLPKENDFGDAMAWEATALELSRRSGVQTPRFEHHRTGYQSVVTVERFDRDGDRRIGYLSADSLLRKNPGDTTDYAALADEISLVSAAPKKDGEELFRRVAVTLMINNIDDHMRNHGLLREAKGWRLSPVFDVNPFYREGTADSTPVSADDDPSNRDIRKLISSAGSFGLTQERAVDIVHNVERSTADWFDVALSYGIAPEGARAMAKGFENRNRELVRNMTPSAPPKHITTATTNAQPRTRLGRFDGYTNTDPEI